MNNKQKGQNNHAIRDSFSFGMVFILHHKSTDYNTCIEVLLGTLMQIVLLNHGRQETIDFSFLIGK